MGEHVPFCMPDRVSLDSPSRGQLREMLQPGRGLERAERSGDVEPAGRDLSPFAPHSFGRQFREPVGHRPGEFSGLRCERESETCGELTALQHPKIVFGKRFRGLAEYPSKEVVGAAEIVDELMGFGIPTHRVDGEVSPGERIRFVDRRVDLDSEPGVPVSGLRVAARQRHVEALSVDVSCDHIERPTLLVDPAETAKHVKQGVMGIDTVDLEVNVLEADRDAGRFCEECVTD